MLILLAATCILLASCGGIVTAFIMKTLDNIVKLYAQAMSTITTTLACVFFFPRRFQFDVIFIVCLGMTIAAIFMYETTNWGAIGILAQRLLEFVKRSNAERRWYIVFIKYACSLLLVGFVVFLTATVVLADYFGVRIFY